MRRVVGAVVGCALCGASMLAQSPTVFRSGVDLVALNVVVTDAQDKFVTGLSPADFAIFEDGVQQEVSFFAEASVPIDLAILLDTLASMSDMIGIVHEAATGFASAVKPADRITIVEIKDTVRFVHPLDGDVDGARLAIRSTAARGSTALYNGLYMTLKELVKRRSNNGEVRRQAIVALSDGRDTASLVGFDDVMEVAKQTGIAIYTITLRSPHVAGLASDRRSSMESEFAMKALAQETGAKPFFPAAIGELARVYGIIAEELASQYSLAYTSTNPRRDGSYRRLSVRVMHPGARSRTRTGYVATVTHPVATLR